jgi:hypothetical protein
MKMLIVTSLKEYQNAVTTIFLQANIHVFSTTGTTGYKDEHQASELHAWFEAPQEKFDSILMYSFTHNENAYQALDLVQQYNKQYDSGHPLRVFILPVEASSY